MEQDLVDIRGLRKYYPIKGGVFLRHVGDIKAVERIDLKIKKGECLGLVGESGCGKTTLGKTILRLHEATEGRVYFDQDPVSIEETEKLLSSSLAEERREGERLRKERDLLRLTKSRLLAMRQKMQIVFQDPSNSLDPRMLVKSIIAEPLVCQKLVSPRDVEQRVLELLNIVGMSSEHLMRYPHEFSGGQRQRIAIARALTTHPEFILMDEPTSALDVSVQAQILNLLKRLQDEFHLTYLFVTHHLLVVKYISNRVAVMYLGRIMELSDTQELFKRPLHPYTKALLSAIPVPDPDSGRERLILSGDVPNPVSPPPGCVFHPRCPFATEVCRSEPPLLEDVGSSHTVACHHWRTM